MNKKQQREAAKAAKKAAAAAAVPVENAAADTKPARVAKATNSAMPKLPPLPKASRARKAKPFVKCACGCDGDTRGMWVPGHDAYARGWALRVHRDVVKLKDVPATVLKGTKHFLDQFKATGTEGHIKLVKGKQSKAEPESTTEQAAPAVGE